MKSKTSRSLSHSFLFLFFCFVLLPVHSSHASAGSLVLLQPNGGEVWTISESRSIKWTSNSTDKLKIEYSTNNGTTWRIAAPAVLASLGSYSWKIPYVASKECRVRISLVSNPELSDESDNPFAVVSSVQAIADKFEIRSYRSPKITLPYRLFVPPDYDPAKKYPIVITLHGSGERGSDNVSHILNNRLATCWAEPASQAKYPGFVLSPQCPSNMSWVNNINAGIPPVQTNPIAAPAEATLEILSMLMSTYNIDTSRVYITGLSLGGFGTWDLIERFPELFAAAIPMSGGGDVTNTDKIINMPIWNFHGAIDNIVPVNLSRSMIKALEKQGRTALYTHCNMTSCSGLPDSVISDALDLGANLIYTEYQLGGHVIWQEAYDYPFLIPWAFSQSRMPKAVWFINLNQHPTLHGTETIQWGSRESDGFVDIYYSSNAGKNWTNVISGYPNSGSFQWNTDEFEDCIFGMLKIVIRDKNNLIYSYNYSKYFTINNPREGVPYTKLSQIDEAGLSGKDCRVKFTAGDPDGDTLNIVLYFKDLNTGSEAVIERFPVGSDTAQQNRLINLLPLQNTNNACIRIVVSDGKSSASDSIQGIKKYSERFSIDPRNYEIVSGNFSIPFTINILDTAKVSDNEYLLTFDDTSSSTQKYFSAYNLSTSRYTVQQSPFSPNNESAIFDGYSFTAEDIRTQQDPVSSAWNERVSKALNFTFSTFFLNSKYPDYNGYARAADYKIIYYSTVVDTSIADTLFPRTAANTFPAVPVNFTVKEAGSDKPVDFVYFRTGTISIIHNIWLKEVVGNKYRRTWRINIYDNEPGRTIPAGDTLYLYTLKGLSILDTIRIPMRPVPVIKTSMLPDESRLYQNYPNPFNPETRIRFSVGSRLHVKLRVYNLLGQEVALLADSEKPAGTYEIKFNASGLPSGVYFYRLDAGNYSESRKFLLLK